MNNQWVMEEIKREMKNISKQMKMENTKYQNLWLAKCVPRGQVIAINAYFKGKKKKDLHNTVSQLYFNKKERKRLI